MTAQSLWRILPLALIGGLTVLALAMGWHRHLTAELLYDHRMQLKSFIAEHLTLALGLYMLAYAAVVALSLPGGLLMTVAGGFLFGWQIATPAVVVAATLGATLVFLAVRTALGEALARRAGPWLARLREGFRENALSYLLFLRLVPAFPFFVVNIAPALLGVRLTTFVLATAIGIIPGTLAFAFAGAGLDSIFDAEGAAYEGCMAAGGTDCRLALRMGTLLTPELLIALGLLGVVALLPIALKRLRRRSPAP